MRSRYHWRSPIASRWMLTEMRSAAVRNGNQVPFRPPSLKLSGMLGIERCLLTDQLVEHRDVKKSYICRCDGLALDRPVSPGASSRLSTDAVGTWKF